MTFDADVSWRLHHQVAVRPEPFGALLYHFGTRKLSFLKNRTIVDVVNSLGDHPDARRAMGTRDPHARPEGGESKVDAIIVNPVDTSATQAMTDAAAKAGTLGV